MGKELRAFTKAMADKMKLKMKQHPERPPDPWNKYDKELLWQRLEDEMWEWRKSIMRVPGTYELLDVANFCFFRWTQIKK